MLRNTLYLLNLSLDFEKLTSDKVVGAGGWGLRTGRSFKVICGSRQRKSEPNLPIPGPSSVHITISDTLEVQGKIMVGGRRVPFTAHHTEPATAS